MLVRDAVEMLGPFADNATAVAMRWEGDGMGDGLSSASVPDGAITTTIALGPVDEEVAQEEELSEDEIERTIAEIREAIERSGGQG